MSSELETKYNPAEVEDKLYRFWVENGFFESKPDTREPYTIVIPPPNVTGVLHMGHMLNNTIQDILVRRARMLGKNACWVPGTDHASIATEAKVVARLAEKGIKKTDISRDEFLKYAWEWKEEHGGIILQQLRKLGASCDWSRTAFTMDEERSRSVLKVFVDLYNKGLIYRGVRMVNWDPKALTALSDEEVIYKEHQGNLYYLRYKIVDEAPTDSPEGGEQRTLERFKTARSSEYALLKQHAKELRKFSTEAESALWEMLRKKNLGDKFRRQHIIDNFIVDFVCLSKKLVVEVDGGYHNEPEVKKADNIRTEILENLGYKVIRFTNDEVLANTDETLEKIQSALKSLPQSGEVGGGTYAVVATTRPETIMGDTAMCINPNDPKNAHLRGKKVIVPLVNRVIPVIEDDYVDVEFGTGCLKVTPAHDVNDYMLGEKYNLPSIDIFNDNGTISEAAGIYVGMDRFEVRKQIVKDLEAAGLLEKTEDYMNKVGFSERTNVPIEPKLSMQWFLKMEKLAKPALDAVMDDDIKFYPSKFKNTYKYWMENVKDWCISRQLWWGHRIPAWYATSLNPSQGGTSKTIVIVAENEEKARAIAEKHPSLGGAGGGFTLRQDDDCLDTWFSSWLWPISLFGGITNPDNEEIKYYYPTSDLVTAPDIIFFWVARMIIAGYEYKHDKPFKNVYFTGIVRDKLGRKMSKSLGNSPDPIKLIEQYGADGVRIGMMISAPAGNDILFDESLCEQGRNFCNKMWNAFRLVRGWQVAEIAQPDYAAKAVDWFKSQFNKTLAEINDNFDKYRISEALMAAYKLFWDDFCAYYLEIIKPAFGAPIDAKTQTATLEIFENLLKILHPFMPFITEEIWQILTEKNADPKRTIMLSLQPKVEAYNKETVDTFDQIKEIIVNIRALRQSKNISPKEPLELFVKGNLDASFNSVLIKLANLTKVEKVERAVENASSFLVRTAEYYIPLGDKVNADEELARMTKELEYARGFLATVMKKLGNEKFVNGAPANVVAIERKKQADAESKIKTLEAGIAKLKK